RNQVPTSIGMGCRVPAESGVTFDRNTQKEKADPNEGIIRQAVESGKYHRWMILRFLMVCEGW
ncbi:MAG: hypothetical protein COW18_07045, partial [Zetaproteobacteria bacterium CG12_big_fil_rev_8_21_14_0_65_54_13]